MLFLRASPIYLQNPQKCRSSTKFAPACAKHACFALIRRVVNQKSDGIPLNGAGCRVFSEGIICDLNFKVRANSNGDQSECLQVVFSGANEVSRSDFAISVISIVIKIIAVVAMIIRQWHGRCSCSLNFALFFELMEFNNRSSQSQLKFLALSLSFSLIPIVYDSLLEQFFKLKAEYSWNVFQFICIRSTPRCQCAYGHRIGIFPLWFRLKQNRKYGLKSITNNCHSFNQTVI